MTDEKLFYARRGVNRYRKTDGTISEYNYCSYVERKRKIMVDDEDFRAFMAEFSRVGDSKLAAKTIKIAHSTALKMALNKCLTLYMEEAAEAEAAQDDSASQSYLSSPTV